jgi:hydrogenase nickel incorporation protein HypA/HybF
MRQDVQESTQEARLHELSICQSMLGIVDSTMAQHEGAKLRKILLDVGRGSTIEPILLREAFEVLTAGGPYEGTELVINDIPISGECRACGREFTYEELAFGCPECGSTDIRITAGLELDIKALEVDD